MVSIKNLSKSFGDVEVLKDVSIEIPKGKIYGLVGQSGVGKSTLLRCINGLEKFDSGELIVDGVNVKSLDEKNMRNFTKNIGMIFQNFSLLGRLSVYENIALPMRCWKYSKSDIDKRVKELLELVEISDKIDARPRELSGGQKQRVAIARALAMNPKILLCDEATSALDPKIANSVIQLLRRINKELGITIIVVTHQMEVLRACCEEITILEGGKVAVTGKVEEIFANQLQVLVNFIGEKNLPEENQGVSLRILLSHDSMSKPFISRMVQELNIDLWCYGGEMDSYRDSVMGSVFINIKEEDFEVVEKYLNDENIYWNMVRRGND